MQIDIVVKSNVRILANEMWHVCKCFPSINVWCRTCGSAQTVGVVIDIEDYFVAVPHVGDVVPLLRLSLKQRGHRGDLVHSDYITHVTRPANRVVSGTGLFCIRSKNSSLGHVPSISRFLQKCIINSLSFQCFVNIFFNKQSKTNKGACIYEPIILVRHYI